MKALFNLAPPQQRRAAFLMNVGFLFCLVMTFALLLNWVVFDATTVIDRMAVFMITVVCVLYPHFIYPFLHESTEQQGQDAVGNSARQQAEQEGQ